MNVNTTAYDTIKAFFDKNLNIDKSLFKTSNDEPTPIGCIEEILSKVPTSFWIKPDLKILDPCCGNGNWHFVVLDLIRRASHRSVEDILSSFYFNDVNEDRLEQVQKLFGTPECDLNITNNDFLTTEDDQMYDLIMANPPYARLQGDGSRASKNHTLIRDFIKRALTLLNDDGYMAFLVPNNWMSLADRNDVVKELSRYQFVWLNIHGAKKWFPKIGSSFTWFVLQKSKGTLPYAVECLYRGENEISQVRSQERSYIPLIYNKYVQSILQRTIEDDTFPKFKVETSSDLHKYTKKDLINSEICDTFKYRLIHTPKQTVYSVRPHKYQDGYKVFISTTDKYSTFVDECGMTQSIAFIRCDSMTESNDTKKILDHDLYRFLNNICRWGNFNNIRILQKFPIPKNPEDIYCSFNITEDEQVFITNFLSK
jgi:hypothetical protein